MYFYLCVCVLIYIYISIYIYIALSLSLSVSRSLSLSLSLSVSLYGQIITIYAKISHLSQVDNAHAGVNIAALNRASTVELEALGARTQWDIVGLSK